MDSSMGNVVIFVWELPVIKFDVDGSTLTASIEYPTGGRDSNTGTYYQNGSLNATYTWADGASGNTATLFESGLYHVSAEVSMRFYTSYESTVTVNVEGEYLYSPSEPGTVEVNFKDGETILFTLNVAEGKVNQSLIQTPSKNGYDFIGWTLDGEPWSGSISSAGPVDILASWKLQNPAVYITADNTEPMGDEGVILTANSSHVLPGVTFDYKWYVISNGSTESPIASETKEMLSVTESGSYFVRITATHGENTSKEVTSAQYSVTFETDAKVTLSVNGEVSVFKVPIGERLSETEIDVPVGFTVSGYIVNGTDQDDPPMINGDCSIIVKLSPEQPQVSITSSDTAPYEGESVTLTVNIGNHDNGIQYTYEWNDGIVGSTRAVTTSGIYSVIVKASYGGFSVDATGSISIEFSTQYGDADIQASGTVETPIRSEGSSYELTSDGSHEDVVVTIHFPDGTIMISGDFQEGAYPVILEEAETYVDGMEAGFHIDTGNIKIESITVTVKVPVDEGYRMTSAMVYHQADNEPVDVQGFFPDSFTDDGTVVFTTNTNSQKPISTLGI